MKITSFKKTKHIVPTGGSGTGYSQPDVFIVCCDDSTIHKVTIDIWYLTIDSIKQEFMRVMHSIFGNSCKNLSEAYIMYNI